LVAAFISLTPSSRASGLAEAVAEGGGAVAVAGSGTGGPAASVTERLGSVAVGSDRAGGPAAGVAERGRGLCRRGRDCGEHERGDGEYAHCPFLLASGSQRDAHRCGWGAGACAGP
jgi:hypothetical protein